MTGAKKSRRGVYYNIEESPYEFRTPYGDIFKFKSAKKLEIYTRDVPKELARLDGIIERHQLTEWIPEEIARLIRRAVYRSFYNKIEG